MGVSGEVNAFDGMHPSFAPMPPEEHTIRAKDIIDLFLKLKRWFGKYGYELKYNTSFFNFPCDISGTFFANYPSAIRELSFTSYQPM